MGPDLCVLLMAIKRENCSRHTSWRIRKHSLGMTEMSAEGVMGRKTRCVLMMCQMLKRREDKGTTWMLVIKLHLWIIS